LGVACAECEDLIRRLLCTDPRRRITVPEIVLHRWMTMAGEDTEFDRLMHNSINPSDEDSIPNELVLEHMSKLGLDKDQVHVVCVCRSITLSTKSTQLNSGILKHCYCYYCCYCWFLPRDALWCKARSCDCMSSFCLSVMLVDQDHIGWKSWKLIAQTISPIMLRHTISQAESRQLFFCWLWSLVISEHSRWSF